MQSELSDSHPCVNKIKNILITGGYWFDYMEHEPVRTSEEAAKIRPEEYGLKSGAKALIIRVKKDGVKGFVMLVVPGDAKFDKNKVKEVVGTKDIRFATEEEVSEITEGVKVGGVPPFGNLFGLKVYADNKIFDQEKIVFNAGDRRVSIAIKSDDYLKIVTPVVVDIA